MTLKFFFVIYHNWKAIHFRNLIYSLNDDWGMIVGIR